MKKSALLIITTALLLCISCNTKKSDEKEVLQAYEKLVESDFREESLDLSTVLKLSEWERIVKSDSIAQFSIVEEDVMTIEGTKAQILRDNSTSELYILSRKGIFKMENKYPE